jgi:hypothetical protein
MRILTPEYQPDTARTVAAWAIVKWVAGRFGNPGRETLVREFGNGGISNPEQHLRYLVNNQRVAFDPEEVQA